MVGADGRGQRGRSHKLCWGEAAGEHAHPEPTLPGTHSFGTPLGFCFANVPKGFGQSCQGKRCGQLLCSEEGQ